MKLSKVTRILNLFQIDQEKLAEYAIDTLDKNRVPNTRVTPHKDPEAVKVSLLRRNGKVELLKEGQQTTHHITSDVIAIHAEFQYKSGHHKAIFVR